MELQYITISISRRTLRIIGIVFMSLSLILGSLTIAYGQSQQIHMSAAVAGWFKTKQVDNQNISLATNMNVWVNGKQFIVCQNPKQPINTQIVPNY